MHPEEPKATQPQAEQPKEEFKLTNILSAINSALTALQRAMMAHQEISNTTNSRSVKADADEEILYLNKLSATIIVETELLEKHYKLITEELKNLKEAKCTPNYEALYNSTRPKYFKQYFLGDIFEKRSGI